MNKTEINAKIDALLDRALVFKVGPFGAPMMLPTEHFTECMALVEALEKELETAPD